MNRIADEHVPIEDLVADPVAQVCAPASIRAVPMSGSPIPAASTGRTGSTPPGWTWRAKRRWRACSRAAGERGAALDGGPARRCGAGWRGGPESGGPSRCRRAAPARWPCRDRRRLGERRRGGRGMGRPCRGAARGDAAQDGRHVRGHDAAPHRPDRAERPARASRTPLRKCARRSTSCATTRPSPCERCRREPSAAGAGRLLLALEFPACDLQGQVAAALAAGNTVLAKLPRRPR